MIWIGTMTDNIIITFQWNYLDSAASLYERVYPVPNYGEHTAHDISREVIVGHVMRDSFIGVLAVNENQEVIGLAWGFAAPNDNTRLRELVIKKLGKEWVENTFVIEAFALDPDYAHTDLGERLHTGLMDRVKESNYERMRVRLEIARMDRLPQTLVEQGWATLQALPHVVWMGTQVS